MGIAAVVRPLDVEIVWSLSHDSFRLHRLGCYPSPSLQGIPVSALSRLLKGPPMAVCCFGNGYCHHLYECSAFFWLGS